MKKLRKYRIIIFAFLITILASIPVNATTIRINHALPIGKGWVTLSPVTTSGTPNSAQIKLTKLETNGVVFQCQYKTASWSGYVDSVNANAINKNFYLYYQAVLGPTTPVQIRFQNFDWTLGAYQVEGTVNVG